MGMPERIGAVSRLHGPSDGHGMLAGVKRNEANDFLASAWTSHGHPWFLADESSWDAAINLVDDHHYGGRHRSASLYKVDARRPADHLCL